MPIFEAQSTVVSDFYGILTEGLETPTSDEAFRRTKMAFLLSYCFASESAPLISYLRFKCLLPTSHGTIYMIF